ncbi:MAG: PASTA domain-containing protein [Oscillospiraceae bacterium]|nr:PASTA domain-containing protein [Oscillospiraceae bacterium]
MAEKKLKDRLKRPDGMLIRRTLVLMTVCGIVAFIVLIGRLYRIMIVEHETYESKAVEQQMRETTVTASRGTIYDTNMKIIAQSATVDTIFISPAEMIQYEENKYDIAAALSEILGVDYDGIMKKWEDVGSWYKTVAVKVEPELAEQVRKYKNDNNIRSLYIVEDSKRYYPYGSLASQIIGFVGTDNYGLEGLEAEYNSYLQGENGRIVRATTSGGTDMLYTGYEDYLDATDGRSIVTTIDTTVEYYLEKHLAQAIEDYEIRDGAMGIVMDVNTGAVLGMCSLPNYDLNDFLTLNEDYRARLDAEELSGEEYDARFAELQRMQWRNRILSDTYEPGSTFKIITLASALEEGAITLNDTFYCGGSLEVPGRDLPLHCWKLSGHKEQTLAEAAQHSCNVAFTNIGIKLGAKRFYDYIEAFGFFERTGLNNAAESAGIWWPRKVFEDPYNYSQLAAASFGQTFNITPIQMVTAVSCVANGGYLMQPYMVRQVLAPDGTVEKDFEPTVVRQVISEKTSADVCRILESVVSAPDGTGKNAFVAGYRVGGKTGTSEKVGQASEDYMVSFVGIAPADDPKVAVLVILDNPSKDSGIYISGGVMAAPVVGNILADVLPYLGVEAESGGDGRHSNVLMPNVKGLSVAEASALLAERGFEIKTVGSGDLVTDQAPVSNIKLSYGSTVVLYAGEDKPEGTVEVPNMVGKTYKAAKAYFEAFGMFIRSTGAAPSESNTIIVQRQSAEPGSKVKYGTVIEVSIIDNDTSIMETRG